MLDRLIFVSQVASPCRVSGPVGPSMIATEHDKHDAGRMRLEDNLMTQVTKNDARLVILTPPSPHAKYQTVPCKD